MIVGNRDAVSNPLGSGAVLAVALAFYLLACVLLIIGGASLATLHAFAAFITLAIVAASNQLVPVLNGTPPKPPVEVIAASIPLVAGFALLILGFAGFATFFEAAVLLGIGSVCWTVWMILRLARAKLEKSIAGVFAFALTAFAAAALIGAGMAVALGTSHFLSLLSLVPVHAALALGAFATTLIVAVAYRFVPMFSLAHAAVRELEKFPQWLVPLATVAGCALFAVFAFTSLRTAAGVVFCCLSIAALTHLRTLRSRMRRHLDTSIRYAIVAWVFGLVSAALFAIGGSSSLTTAAVICAVLGWLSISILGYAYKIAGFLAWETAKARSPHASLPPLSKALPERTALVALWFLGVGTIVTATLSLTPFPIALGGSIYLLGAMCATTSLLVLTNAFLGISHAAYSAR
jgi:hypothetical protein